MEWGEGEVEDEVEGKREGDEPWDLAGEGFVKDGAERNCNDCIEQSPNGPKNPSRRGPSRLNQLRVPRVSIHPQIIPHPLLYLCAFLEIMPCTQELNIPGIFAAAPF